MQALPISLLVVASMLIPPTRYHAADGTWVRKPHIYKRHPNFGTDWTGTCKDGAVTFAHVRSGACSHHGGVASWHTVPTS